MELSIEEKAGFLMDFLQWLSEQDYHLIQAGNSGLSVQRNYTQVIVNYLDFDWGQPQAESVTFAMLLAIKNRLINPDRTPDEIRPRPVADDLVKAFILSKQVTRN